MNDQEQELQLQRLVDGQLTRSQIQELLAFAESDADLWREIAAVFIEDQIWQKEILSDLSVDGSASEELRLRSKRRSVGGHPSKMPFLFSVAAAALLGIWLGNVWPLGLSDDPGNLMSNPVANSQTPERQNPEQLLNQPELQSPNGGGQRPHSQLVDNFMPAHHLSMGEAGDVPLYTLEEAKKMGLNLEANHVPQETVDQFNRQGYQLQQNTRYISGRAPDGRKVLVPIRSVRLNPGN